MFTHPTIASELARQRHRDFVARADRHRLSRLGHPSVLPAWTELRASLLRWMLGSRARAPAGPMSDRPSLDGDVILDLTDESAIASDRVPRCSPGQANAS